MPLPAALQARLAKRGLLDVKTDAKNTKPPAKSEEVEEVFAEDYDDPSKPDTATVAVPVQPTVPVVTKVTQPLSQAIVDAVGDGPLFFETTACPNRINPYHECVPYCKNRYGMREWDPDISMMKRRERMLSNYPLPEGWVEVGDYDTGRYYYWNINTDEVSWLSPSHPKASITRSAESLGLVGKVGNLDVGWENTVDLATLAAFNTDSGSDTSLSDEEDFVEKKRKLQKRGRQGQGKKDDLDPMDPAAYSDIPRGGWSDGLDQRGKAKTGVDSTASGPLFQQRPYPSPGEILRVNQGLKKKK
ncbi:polyglutamine-binding protein 1-like [Biomphalaria glabrata]|uniref:Polyglutamine-binding protein 1 n=1 Tax=Biomphalaria glabrata TaxID=6526 RepID=A0A9W3A5C6_BIOGL|nr:polyglutamine-binding protein 1-like [Biomphalaria glabrata]KAI8781829.1 polyglutamine-binding protein 1 [Biomphalaria glabrata]